MKICHITTVHPVQDARIFYRMCRPLAATGNPVVLIAPGSFAAEEGLRPSSSNQALSRAPRLYRAGLALKAALAEDADVYHFHDPELIFLGLLLKARRPGCTVVYDVHEDYPSMMRDKHWLPKWSRPMAAFGMRRANRLAARILDGIVVADRGVAQEFAAAAHKVLVHYNFPLLDLFNHAGPSSAPDADLVYVGGINRRTGMFVLFDALKILAQCGIKPVVKLAGYTDNAAGGAELHEAIRSYGLQEQVRFYGRLPHHEVAAFLRSGRIGLIMLQPTPKFMKNIPTKMFEYWACGLPVIAGSLPPVRQFLTDGLNGCLFDPTRPAQLAERIAFLMRHPQRAEAFGHEGRRQVQTQWNNERQCGALVDFYRRIGAQKLSATRRSSSTASRRRVWPIRERPEPGDSSAR